MWKVIGIILVGLIIIVLEVPRLMKDQEKKELFVFITLLVIGVGLSLAKALNAPIPNPLDALKFIYQPISDAVISLLS